MRKMRTRIPGQCLLLLVLLSACQPAAPDDPGGQDLAAAQEDLSQTGAPGDLTSRADLTSRVDLTTLVDLARPADLATPDMICVRQCSGRTCGLDGCGGVCGTCPNGQSCNASGLCNECTSGESQCVANNIGIVRTCVGGRWTQSACPAWQACADKRCALLCDGGASLQAGEVAACFFPINDGVNFGNFWLSTDTNRLLLNELDVGATNGNLAVPVAPANGTAWPYAWVVAGAGAAGFKLNRFNAPVSRVRLIYRMRRSGVTLNSTTQAVFFSTSSIFAQTNNMPIPTFSYAQYSAYIDRNFTPQYNYNAGWNYVGVAPGGIGFGAPYDRMDLNYLLLAVLP